MQFGSSVAKSFSSSFFTDSRTASITMTFYIVGFASASDSDQVVRMVYFDRLDKFIFGNTWELLFAQTL